jgi:hypothetical protein
LAERKKRDDTEFLEQKTERPPAAFADGGLWMAKLKDQVCQASFSAHALALIIRMAEIIGSTMHWTVKNLALVPKKLISLIAL